MTSVVDPRVRVREALLTLVRPAPTSWREPSLVSFRNRLLDLTGSDARPLADLLMEAEQRGWHEMLPRERLPAAQWDALAVPFVMRWSAERFIQADMAQWAAESWALAFDVIAPEQLRVAPPSRAPSPTASPTPGVASTTARTPATSVAGRRQATPAHSTGATASRAAASTAANAMRSGARAATNYSPRRTSGIPMLDPRIVWGLAAAAAISYVGFLGRIAWSLHQSKATSGATNSAVRMPAAATTSPTSVAAPKSAPTASAAISAPAAATPADAARDTVVNTSTITSMESAKPGPGVPGLTSGLLNAGIVGTAGTINVEPARRANGRSTPVDLPPLPPSLTYDEVVLTDGSSMRGRVEIVRAGSVIFRDLRTGLRHDLRKDDIDRIITEFGTPVRFRAAGAAPGALNAAAMRQRAETGVRARGVSGVYTVQYGQPQAVGSPECLAVWNRPANVVDRARVHHVAGADTLSITFEGGDTFPSNIDADGYFASTFRIVPNQARTSTALTTRLTGQFLPNGDLTMQVNIVFYRRLRDGKDVTCAVTVPTRPHR